MVIRVEGCMKKKCGSSYNKSIYTHWMKKMVIYHESECKDVNLNIIFLGVFEHDPYQNPLIKVSPDCHLLQYCHVYI